MYLEQLNQDEKSFCWPGLSKLKKNFVNKEYLKYLSYINFFSLSEEHINGQKKDFFVSLGNSLEFVEEILKEEKNTLALMEKGEFPDENKIKNLVETFSEKVGQTNQDSEA